MMERTGLERAIRQAADPAVLVQRVSDEALSLLEGADGVLVWLSHDPGRLTLVCCSGHLEDRIGDTLPMEGNLVGLVLKTGETLRCDDAESDPRVDLDFCQAFHVVSSVCVPLRRGSETVGVLSVTSSRKRTFDDRDVATLTSLAEFIGVVITAAADLAESPRRCSPGPGATRPAQRSYTEVTGPQRNGSLPTS